MNEIINKTLLGEITLDEVWGLLKDRVDFVVVYDGEFKWGPYERICLTPGVRLELFDLSFEEGGYGDPAYSFDLNSKVKVKGDSIEIIYKDSFDEEEIVSLSFFARPEPQIIDMGFLLGD